MTIQRGNLGAAKSETWAELYSGLPGTTWQTTEAIPRTTSAFAMTAVAISLSMSSPYGSSISKQARLFPQSSSVEPNDVVLAPVPAIPLPSTGERLAAVQSAMGLNKSQLADVCRVKRQTIYDWYAGNFEAEGMNALRLTKLYRLVTAVRRSGLRPVPLRTVDKPLLNGNSLLDLLCADELDSDGIRQTVAQLQPAPGTIKESARSQGERLGMTPLSEEEMQAQLDANIDDFLDG